MLSLKSGSVMTESEYKKMQKHFEKLSDENEPLKVVTLMEHLGEGNILRIKVHIILHMYHKWVTTKYLVSVKNIKIIKISKRI